MTDKELMLQGKEFFTGDPELMTDKAQARINADIYNSISDRTEDAKNLCEAQLRRTFGLSYNRPHGDARRLTAASLKHAFFVAASDVLR